MFFSPQNKAQQKKRTAVLNVAHQNSRVGLRAPSMASAFAQSGHFNTNVAPSEQRYG